MGKRQESLDRVCKYRQLPPLTVGTECEVDGRHGIIIGGNSKEENMYTEHEQRIAEFEHARNDALDRYFEARPQIERTIERERIFDAGYRMAWEFLKSDA